jgi:hypothetical protein
LVIEVMRVCGRAQEAVNLSRSQKEAVLSARQELLSRMASIVAERQPIVASLQVPPSFSLLQMCHHLYIPVIFVMSARVACRQVGEVTDAKQCNQSHGMGCVLRTQLESVTTAPSESVQFLASRKVFKVL